VTSPVLSLRQLQLTLPGHCEVALDVEVAGGEILTVMGPSGSGKSSLLAAIAGFLSPAFTLKGDIFLGQQRLNELPAEQRGVGLLFQDALLFPHMSVAQNLAFALPSHVSDRRGAVAQALAAVGLAGYEERDPDTLSGGQKARVALQRLLLSQPRAVLLDEPFSSLDNRLRDQIRDDTVAILKQAGTPTLLVTHDPEEAMRMADRIGIMQAGRLVQVDSPEGVYGQPQSLFAARFLSETNEIKGRVQAGRLDTPFGTFPAPHLADGTEALLVFRPEALAVQNSAELGGADLDCRVLRARSLGPYRRVEVQLNGAGETHLVARLAPGPLPEAGSRLRLTLDKAACHIFPSS